MYKEWHKNTIEYLKSEEGKKAVKEFFNKLEDEKNESIRYFESEEFNNNLKLLKDWMIQNKIYLIDGDAFEKERPYHWRRSGKSYYKKMTHLTNEKSKIIPLPIDKDIFYKITSSISDSLDGFEKIDESYGFSNSYIEYKEFIIRYIYGQGTITRFELDISRYRNISIKNIIK